MISWTLGPLGARAHVRLAEETANMRNALQGRLRNHRWEDADSDGRRDSR